MKTSHYLGMKCNLEPFLVLFILPFRDDDVKKFKFLPVVGPQQGRARLPAGAAVLLLLCIVVCVCVGERLLCTCCSGEGHAG